MACLPVMILSLLLLGGGAFVGGFIGGWSPAGFGIGALVGAIMELIGFMRVMSRENRRSTDTGERKKKNKKEKKNKEEGGKIIRVATTVAQIIFLFLVLVLVWGMLQTFLNMLGG